MEHQKCYVWEPSKSSSAKHRRTRDTAKASWQLREDMFTRSWTDQHQRIEEVFEAADQITIGSILDFVSNCEAVRRRSKIPTALLVAGPNIASHGPFFQHLARAVTKETRSAFVVLSSADATNLKGLLKHLIQSATRSRDSLNDEEDEVVPEGPRRGPRLLNYDLKLLCDWFSTQELDQIVLAFRDSEAFDGILLSELVQQLSYYQDRIPFVLLFGLATSVENFHTKLRPVATRHLEGQQLDLARANDVFEEVFWTTVHGDHVRLRIGHVLGSILLDRQNDHVQSAQAFVDAIHYAYMSHYYANPLTIFLDGNLAFGDVPKDHFDAVRNLASHRRSIESLLDQKKTTVVRNLLSSNTELFHYLKRSIEDAQKALSRLIAAVGTLYAIHSCLTKPSLSRSSLYISAVAGRLTSSSIVRDLLLTVKVASSDILARVLDVLIITLIGNELTKAKNIRTELERIIGFNPQGGAPLRSEHDVRQQTLRTTVVAQKVELSKQKSTFTKRDAAYSELAKATHQLLVSYFTEAFVDPQELPFHEIVLYDLKSPHRDVFMPMPRFSIERALSCPHDYLNCQCCLPSGGDGDPGGALSSTQPTTAILYQLYLESGSLINVSDLWSAFNAILGDGSDDDDPLTMALFQRGLAELAYLGLIKASRKRTDHIAKVSWKGL